MNREDAARPLRAKRRGHSEAALAPDLARVVDLKADGWIVVDDDHGASFACLWLQTSENAVLKLQPGDRVLVLRPGGDKPGIVLGRVSPHRSQSQEVRVEAAEVLTLACGKSSLTLQADGKVLLKGDDVVVRAKGTQRIRAGHVAIN